MQPPCRFHPGQYVDARATRYATNQRRSYYCDREGCGTVTPTKRLLVAHLAECPFELLSCPNCASPILRKDLEKHMTVCPKVMLPCPNQCGALMPRGEMASHIVDCPLQPCPCENLGCNEVPVRQDARKHSMSCPYGTHHCAWKCVYTCLRWAWEAEGHSSICPMQPVQCGLGCNAQVPRRHLNQHYRAECPASLLSCWRCGCKVRRKDFVEHDRSCLLRLVFDGWWRSTSSQCTLCGEYVFGRAPLSSDELTPMQRHQSQSLQDFKRQKN